MKKAPRSRDETIRNVVLYLDDLQGIAAILKDGFEEVEVSGDGFELERPEELDEYRDLSAEQLRSLRFRGGGIRRYYGIVVMFYRSGVTLRSPEDDAKHLGVLTQLMDLLKRRRRTVRAYLSRGLAAACGVLIYLGGWPLIWGRPGFQVLAPLLVTAVPLGVAIFFMLPYLWPGAFSTVAIRREKSYENVGFMARNKDKLILAVVSAIVGAIVGAVVTKLASIVFK